MLRMIFDPFSDCFFVVIVTEGEFSDKGNEQALTRAVEWSGRRASSTTASSVTKMTLLQLGNRGAVADFGGLRGVMALQDLQVGDEIVSIPGECAINLGSQSDDPVRAALALLAAKERDADAAEREAYWSLLPPPDAADLRSS